MTRTPLCVAFACFVLSLGPCPGARAQLERLTAVPSPIDRNLRFERASGSTLFLIPTQDASIVLSAVTMVTSQGSRTLVTGRTPGGAFVNVTIDPQGYLLYDATPPSTGAAELARRLVFAEWTDGAGDFSTLAFSNVRQSAQNPSIYFVGSGSEVRLATSRGVAERFRSMSSATDGGGLIEVAVRDDSWFHLRATVRKENGSVRFIHLLRVERPGEAPGRPPEVAGLLPLSDVLSASFLDTLLARRAIEVDSRCVVQVTIPGIAGTKAVSDRGAVTRWY